jgi:hypothetical protein
VGVDVAGAEVMLGSIGWVVIGDGDDELHAAIRTEMTNNITRLFHAQFLPDRWMRLLVFICSP